ncbi:hypothetical protein V1478_005510, partial [Vespula squamosa]
MTSQDLMRIVELKKKKKKKEKNDALTLRRQTRELIANLSEWVWLVRRAEEIRPRVPSTGSKSRVVVVVRQDERGCSSVQRKFAEPDPQEEGRSLS